MSNIQYMLNLVVKSSDDPGIAGFFCLKSAIGMCAPEGAPGVPPSMVVKYIHPVSDVPSILVGFPMTLSTAPRRLGRSEGPSDYFIRTRS